MPTDLDAFTLPGDRPPSGEKLQKFMAAAGVASRRHSEVIIEQNRVTINGKVATLGARVQPGDRVLVNGVEIGPDAPRHFMVNKPNGVITTMDDPQGRPTVSKLAPQGVRVYPVGRLDQETSGLLLLTNDGELAHRLMHPSFGVQKTYRVMVVGKVKPFTLRKLAEGVELEDGMTAPAQARIIDAVDTHSVIELQIHEGKNRQVRRMCEAVGHPVRELVRIGYGPLTLGNLAVGTSRPLLDTEIRRLRKAAGLQPPRQKRGKEGAAGKDTKDYGSEKEAARAGRDADAQQGRNPGEEQPAQQRGAEAAPGGGRGQGRDGGASGTG
ncbi:MAG: pseudouridine synthase, partial [Thermoleophilia bacterium]|nr:pseudouridine synthase [Thermoleophilia bacterium]